MYNKNAAYDLSLFDEKTKKGKVINLNVKKLKRVRALKAKRALIICGVTVCTALASGVGLFISGQAKLSELTAETAELSNKIQENESLYTQLSMKRKSEVFKDSLEFKLENEMNMVKNDNIEYINVLNSDKAEISENSSGFIGLKNQVTEFCNNLFNS